MNSNLNTRHNRAFSLMEMLIVIAIIGIIAAIAIPNIHGLNKEKTRTAGQAPAITEPQPNTGPIEGQSANVLVDKQDPAILAHAQNFVTAYNLGLEQKVFNSNEHPNLGAKLQAILNPKCQAPTNLLDAIKTGQLNETIAAKFITISTDGKLALKSNSVSMVSGGASNDKI